MTPERMNAVWDAVYAVAFVRFRAEGSTDRRASHRAIDEADRACRALDGNPDPVGSNLGTWDANGDEKPTRGTSRP